MDKRKSKKVRSFLLGLLGLILFSTSPARAEHSVVATIPVGKKPVAVAIEPTLDLAAVTNKKDETVSIVDLSTESVTSTFPVGEKPSGVAVSADHRVAVSNKKDKTLTLINLTDNTTRTIPLDGKPSDVALSHTRDLALAPYESKGKAMLAFVHLTDPGLSAEVKLGKGKPVAIAVDEVLGVAAVALDKRLVLVDLASRTVRAPIPLTGHAVAIALDQTRGHALLITRHDEQGTLLFINLVSGQQVFSLPIVEHPIAVAVNPITDEALLIARAEAGPSILTRISLDSHAKIEEISLEGRPRDIAVNPRTTQIGIVGTQGVPTDDGDSDSDSDDDGQSEGRLTLWQLPHPAPMLSEISPTEADAGSPDLSITLKGSRLVKQSIVAFNGITVTPTFISDKELTALIPASALISPGTVEVRVITPAPGGGTSEPQSFTIKSTDVAPVINSFSPSSGSAGTVVTVSGSGFVPGQTTARVDGLNATITRITETELTLVVPPGAPTASIFVTAPAGIAVSPSPFTMLPSQDFTMGAVPSLLEVIQGGSVSLQILLSGAGGTTYTGPIGLSTGPVPSGVVPFFTPSTGRTGQPSYLNIFAPSTLSSGTYPITVYGQAQIDNQAVVHETTFTLNVLGAGTTTLSGQILSSKDGAPLASILVKNGSTSVTTDAGGNFFFSAIPIGKQLLLVDGTPAGTTEISYPIDLPVQVDVASGIDNILPYPVYLHEINIKHFTVLDSSREVFVTDPSLPGFELRIPAGVEIIGWDGIPNTKMSVTAVPVDRLPLPPVPDGALTVYMFNFFKPGGGRPTQPIPVKLPNDAGLPPGTVAPLYYYDEEPVADPTSHRWKQFGTGTVSSDARQIVSDPGVGIPKFCCGGVTYTYVILFDDGKPTPDRPTREGDPVDLATGLFTFQKADLVLPGVIPVEFTRYYTARREVLQSPLPGPFGFGTRHSYHHRLVPFGISPDALVLIGGDDSRAPFSKNSDETFTNNTTPSLRGAVVTTGFNGSRTLRFRDGKKWFFSATGFLIGIENRSGNRLVLLRDRDDRLIRIFQSERVAIQVDYDSSSRITRLTDTLGRTVQYSYNTAGLLATVTDAEGGVTRYTYDTQRRMVTLTDARGILFLTNEYDATDRIIRQTDANGGVFEFRYFGPSGRAVIDVPVPIVLGPTNCQARNTIFVDPTTQVPPTARCIIRIVRPGPASRLVTQAVVIDPEGNPTSYRFSAAGYPLEITDSAGKTTLFERATGTNQLLSVTRPLGDKTVYTYDANNNQTSVTDAAGNTTQYEYEPTFNQVTKITDPLGQITTFQYDNNGNLTQTTNPAGEVSAIAYNAQDKPVSVSDPLGNTTAFTYDEAGNLVGTTDPLGNATRRAYDTVGRLVRLTDPKGQSTTYTYDKLNRVTAIQQPNALATRFTYDPNGNLLTVTDANGQVTTYTYDSMDRLASRTDPLGRVEQYTYDLNGNLTRFTDRKGQVGTFTYDALDRRTKADYADRNSTAFAYDAVGRLTQVSDTASGQIQMSYDVRDRLTREVTPQGVVEYTYDAVGRRTAMTVNGSSPVAYGYDAASRLLSVGQGALGVGLGYDVAGRRTSLSLPNSVTTNYAYDAASRLTGIDHQTSAPIESLSYTYDAAGNRIGISRTGGPVADLPANVHAAHDAANEMIRFNADTLTYDNNGNLLSDGEKTYIWDARNRLVGMTGPDLTASFRYDALGRRVSKTINDITTQYQYDANDIVAEINGGVVTATYLRGLNIDEPFVRRSSSGDEHYLSDALGSTLALTDSTGTVTTTYSYDPFGNTTVTGTSTNPFMYTGRENDSTGLYFYRARYYSPMLQRFISPDPLLCGVTNTFPLQSVISNPQTVNAFAYVNNSPVNLRDPLGLTPDCQYYNQRCEEVRTETARFIYCDAAKTVCEKFPEDTYTNCVRNCLQTFDQNICATGSGRKDPSAIGCYLIGAHATCIPTCIGGVTFEGPR